jgi:hypothetical protein
MNRNGKCEGPGGGDRQGALCTGFTQVCIICLFFRLQKRMVTCTCQLCTTFFFLSPLLSIFFKNLICIYRFNKKTFMSNMYIMSSFF